MQESDVTEAPELDADTADFRRETDALWEEVDGVEPRPQSENEPVTVDIETGEILFGAISPTFDLLCPNWNVTTEEKKALAEAYGGVIDKYFPNLGAAAPELIALAMTAAIFAPRVGQPRKLEKKDSKGAEGEQSAD